MRGNLGWQDQGCLQCTSMNLLGGESSTDVIQARGQARWADLVWIEMLKYVEGQNITSSSSVVLDAEWGSSFSAGTCRQLYSGVCFVAPWGMDITYHYLFRVSVSYSTIVDCINEQFIMCGCSLSVACSVGNGCSCHIGLDAIEGYLILRAVVLTYIYGISFTSPARVAVVALRWVSGLPMLWPSWGCIPWWRCILWLRWLATMTFQSPVSNLFSFGATGIPCRAVCSTSWVLSCAIGAVLGGCRWCVTITIVTGVGSSVPVMADHIHRFEAVGDLFLSMLNGEVVHCNVSYLARRCLEWFCHKFAKELSLMAVCTDNMTM